jgi:hypothetical protein
MISYRDTLVDDLEIRGRMLGILRRMRIRTVGEAEKKLHLVSTERGCGPVLLRELRDAIASVKQECEAEMSRAAGEDLAALPAVGTDVEPGLQAIILWAMANQRLIRFYIKHGINEVAIASAFGVEIEGNGK